MVKRVLLLVLVLTMLPGCEAGMWNRMQALMLLGKRDDGHHPGTYVDQKSPSDRIDEDFAAVKAQLAEDEPTQD